MDQERRDFNISFDELKLKPSCVDFIYAPYILDRLREPLNTMRSWHDTLKPHGVLAVVTSDRDELIRQGRKFAGARFNKTELAHLIEDAGFRDWREVNFREFDLCGEDSANAGFFAEK